MVRNVASFWTELRADSKCSGAFITACEYYYPGHHGFNLGYADTEFGIKYRIVKETDNLPQIGIFPLVEIPTVKNNEFSDGKTKIYLRYGYKNRGKINNLRVEQVTG